MSPAGTRNPVSPSSTTSETPPTSVATTGLPAASASMIVAGVPSLAEVSTTASRDREPGRDVLLVAEKEARARDPELVRALLEPPAVVAVADEEEKRVDAAPAERDERRQQVVGLLHGGHPAEPADDERVARDPVPAANLGGVAGERDAPLELEAEPDDGELLHGRRAADDVRREAPPLRPAHPLRAAHRVHRDRARAGLGHGDRVRGVRRAGLADRSPGPAARSTAARSSTA